MNYPKIKDVKALKNRQLEVVFQNGKTKIYDCNPLLVEDIFSQLKDDYFFKNIKVDQGGYGISWNDYIDLSESELWINGNEIL